MGALTVTPSTPMETTSTPVSFGRFHTFGSYWSESSWLSLDFTANLLNIKNTTHKGFQGWALRHTQGLKTQPVDYLNLTCLLSFVYVGNRMWWFSWCFLGSGQTLFLRTSQAKYFATAAGSAAANAEQLCAQSAVQPCRPYQCPIFHWSYEVVCFLKSYLNMWVSVCDGWKRQIIPQWKQSPWEKVSHTSF